VLATPSIELDHKTAQLFGALDPVDFSSGTRVHRVAASLQDNRLPDAADLGNAFERPLSTRLPEVSQVREAMLRAGAPFVALSGAGPTHYTIVPELNTAIRIGAKLQKDAPIALRTMVARPTSSGPLIRVEKTIESAETL